ncbi:MAG TPA: hypothetical protein VFS54_00800 [Solirubrobacterales bacterium]|nr:hypothetical protein [Solirubrobacterales bacterium]
MSSTVLYMSMSLDGFVAGPNESVSNGLGDGGERLHEWFFAGAPTEHGGVPGRPEGANGEMMDEALATGAVVAGRGTFEPAKGWRRPSRWGADLHPQPPAGRRRPALAAGHLRARCRDRDGPGEGGRR